MAATPDATVPAWALVAGSIVTGGFAFLQYWLGKRADGRAAALETQRKTEAEEFRQEERLRDRVDKLLERREQDSATVQSLRGELATLSGRVTEVIGENERLKRTNEEQAREFLAKTGMHDIQMSELREELRQAREELRAAHEVIAELRKLLSLGDGL